MKSHTDYMTFNTEGRREFVRITENVQAAVDASGVSEGMVLVSAMHITAAVWVNDDEPGLQEDMLVHHQVVLPITDGRLDLGPWQAVFYCEFDGRRSKRLVIKVMGD